MKNISRTLSAPVSMSFLPYLFAIFLIVADPSQFARAAQNVEKTFKDPKSGKSGKYMIAIPDKSVKAKSLGLLVFFHGSGSTASYASGFEGLVRVAGETGLIPLALQAPNGNDTWANHATGPSNQHDIYAKSLIDSIIPTLPALDSKRVVLVGLSAGSTFLSGDFLPRFIQDYKGAAVLLCGGGGPLSLGQDLTRSLSRTVSTGMPLAFYIQQKDFLYRQTIQGISYWRSRNATVFVETPADGGHCAFDVNKEMSRLIRELIARKS